jgi:hypothetical protein
MSLYGTDWNVDADDHTRACGRWSQCGCADEYGHRGRVWLGHDWHAVYDVEKPCTCGCGPIAYQGSHVLPSDDDPRGGSLSMCTIGGHITRDGRDDGPEDDDDIWPYVRVSLTEGGEQFCNTVVLDRSQVESLRDYLSDALGRMSPDDSTPSGDVSPLAVG